MLGEAGSRGHVTRALSARGVGEPLAVLSIAQKWSQSTFRAACGPPRRAKPRRAAVCHRDVVAVLVSELDCALDAKTCDGSAPLRHKWPGRAGPGPDPDPDPDPDPFTTAYLNQVNIYMLLFLLCRYGDFIS